MNEEGYTENGLAQSHALAAERTGMASHSIQFLRQRATQQVKKAAVRMAKRVVVRALLQVLAILLFNPVTLAVLAILAGIAALIIITMVILSAIDIF